MRPPLFALVLLTGISPSFAVQEAVPSAFPSSRYERMLEQSPFALATPPAPTEAPKDSFTKDWVVTGLVPERDAQGVERYFVTIRSKDQTQQFSLYGNNENAEGVSIVSVERSPLTGKSKVTLKKGNEFGVVEFNQMEVQSAPPPAPGVPGRQAPGAPPRPLPGAQPRPTLPGASPQIVPNAPGLNPLRQPVNGRPQVPRPNFPTNGAAVPQIVPQPTNGAAPLPAAPGAGDQRRRIRVINSKP